MSDILELHQRALDEFGRRVHAVRPDQWHDPTPCTEWDVHALVNHLVNEQEWVAPMIEGQTIEQVGHRFDGDQLGDDPAKAWDRYAVEAHHAIEAPGALNRTVHLSYGDTTAESYTWDMVSDALVHAWDLARAIGADESLDPELVNEVFARIEPQADTLAASGYFAPRVPVPDDADPQTKLIALCGRHP